MDNFEYTDVGGTPEGSAPPFEKEKLRGRAEDMARSGRDSTAHEVDNIGVALHSAADRLREQNDFLAPWADSLARGADNVSNYLKEHSPSQIMDDVRDFSHRNPYVTVGGMFAAGLALSRFLKAGRE